MSLSTQDAAALLLAAACTGLSKGGFGGAGMLAVVLMASVFPPLESTGALLPMLIIADIAAVRIFHRHADLRLVLRLLPPTLLGVAAGWLLMPRLCPQSFGRVIGGMVLALLGLVLLQRWRPGLLEQARRRRFAWPAGWLAGLTTMLANAAGSVMSIYLLACKLPKMEFVGTAAWFFFAVNLLKVPFSASLGLITAQNLLLNTALAPVIVGSVFLGRWLLGKVNQQLFEWLMMAFSALGAARLLMA
ncbi:MAG: sulfite exporter TauE/SafE family protein [Terrimicrobiaceae bacterium]|nr:sulfite exporter TauE/SafE family protein [Terrimicrobiaceae bacterium]